MLWTPRTIKGYSRPQSIQESTKTESGNKHEDDKLYNHRSKGQNHQVILERYESKSIDVDPDVMKSNFGVEPSDQYAHRGNMRTAMSARKSIPVVRAQ